MESLKPCACGKTPENLCIMDGSTYRWRYVSGICCGEWQIEARVDRADRTDTEAIEAECVRAWNDAPRASTMPGELNAATGSIVGRDDYVADLEKENAALLRVLKENHIRLHIGKAGTSWWVVPRADWERAKDLPVILDLHVQKQKG